MSEEEKKSKSHGIKNGRMKIFDFFSHILAAAQRKWKKNNEKKEKERIKM